MLNNYLSARWNILDGTLNTKLNENVNSLIYLIQVDSSMLFSGQVLHAVIVFSQITKKRILNSRALPMKVT